jgi:chitin disaccharide deacetylase
MPSPKPLAERLGYGADDRLLIVNCDDLGVSHAANVATLAAMVDGVATSATLMVPCPFAREAARMFEGLDVGVHLTLTSEYPGYRWGSLTGRTSLHDDDGYFPRTTAAAMARVEENDMRAECRAQIDQALGWGIDVTHLDAHMHAVEAREDLFHVLLDLAAEYGLPVRMIEPAQAERLGLAAFHSARQATARGILCNDRMVYPWPRPTRDVFFETLPGLPAGVSEIFAHPVRDGEELRGYDLSNTAIRIHDAACLTDPTVRELIEQQGFKPISYRPLRELQRHGKVSANDSMNE